MINTPPPATSLAVAPEASLEAAELQHCLICSVLHRRCVRQGGEGQQAAAAAFLTLPLPSTEPPPSMRNGVETFGFWCFFAKNITQIYSQGSNASYCILLKSTQQISSAAMYIKMQSVKRKAWLQQCQMHILIERCVRVCVRERERGNCRFLQVKPSELQQ